MTPRTKTAIAVAVWALVLHGVGIFGEYTLDDFQAVLGHPAVTGEAPIWEAFTREYWGRPIAQVQWSSSWRPLTTLTFALEHRVTAEPWLHHAVGVGAFVGLCVLVTRFAEVFVSTRASAVVGIAYASMPVHVESVASIVGRADVLAALASVGALLLLLRGPAAARPSVAAQFGSAALFAVALLCKETVALLPAVAGWLLWIKNRHDGWRAVVPVAAMAVVGLGYLGLRQQLLSVELPPGFIAADNQLIGTGGFVRGWGTMAVAGHYAELCSLATRLCADHTYGDVVVPQGLFGGGAVWAWLGLGVVAWAIRDAVVAVRGRSPGLGMAALLAYALVGHFVIPLSVIVAERLMLWPTVLVVVAVVERMAPIAARRPTPILLGAMAVLIAWGVRTVDRTVDWHDRLRLYESSARMCPAAVHNRLNLAGELRRRGRSEEAVWHYGVAAAGRNRFPEPFVAEAFDAERTQPLRQRLPRLPALVGMEASVLWPGLHRFLVADGAQAEADIVRRIATGGGTP